MFVRVTVSAIFFTIACGCAGGPRATEAASKATTEQRCPTPPPRSSEEAPDLVLQEGHSRTVRALALSQDGRILASSGLDGVVRIWDTTSGLLLRRVGTGGMPLAIGLDDKGETLAYYAPDGGLLSTMVVDLTGRSAPRRIPFGNIAFAFSPDGRRVAVGAMGVQIYDAMTGTEVARADLPMVQAIAFDALGDRVAAASGPELAIVDAKSGAVVQRFDSPTKGPIPAGKLAFSERALVVRSVTGEAHVVSLDGARPPILLNGTFADVAASGPRVFTIDMQGTLRAWEVTSGASLGAVTQTLQQGAIAASRDGTTLALAGEVSPDLRRLRVLDGRSFEGLRTLEGKTSGVTAIDVTADGARLATGSSLGAVARWKLTTGELEGLSTPEETSPAESVAFDPSGTTFVTTMGTSFVRVRDAESGRVLRQWQPHENHAVVFVGFPGGTRDLLTVSRDGEVKRWGMTATPTPPKAREHRFTTFAAPLGTPIFNIPFPIREVVLSRDGSKIAAASDIGEVAVVRLVDGALTWSAKLPASDAIHSFWIAFDEPANRLFVSGLELEKNPTGVLLNVPTLRVIEAETGRIERSLHPGTAGPMHFRKEVLALGGAHPALLDAALELRRVSGVPDQKVTAVAAHPIQDAFFFAGDGGGTTWVDVATSTARALFVATANGEYVTTTPDGLYRASLDGARSVAWSFSSPLEAFPFDGFGARRNRPDLLMKRLGGEHPAAPPLARPPSVRIGRDLASSVTDRASVLVRAHVDAPYAETLRAFVNGRPAAERTICGPGGDTELDVPVVAGKNRVTLVAYDGDGNASNPASLDIEAQGERMRKPELWIVSVGVSHYPELGPEMQLEVADDDARAIASALKAQAGSGKPFATAHTTLLTDADATVTSVTRAVDGLAAMQADDLAVVFFAGHGVKIDGDSMVFLTANAALSKPSARANGIGWSSVEASLAKARGHVLMLLDACHSGHVSTELIAPNEALARALSESGRSGVLVFAATRGAQLSYEVSSPGAAGPRGLDLVWTQTPPNQDVLQMPTGHGLFTSAVLDALQGKAPDRDGSGALESSELVDFVTDRVRAASNGLQTPWVARRELFGDFPIARPKP